MASITCTYAVDIAVTPAAEPFFHRHNCTELIFIRRGEGFVYHDQKREPYRTNQLIVYQRGACHADNASCDGMQFCIGIDGTAAEYVPVGVWDCSPEILNVIEMLHQKVLEQPGKLRSLDMDIISGYLVMLLREELPASSASRQTTVSDEDVWEIAKRELDAHIDSPYTLDQLSAKVFVSKGYLRRLFKEKYGESPLTYLLRKKPLLAAACPVVSNGVIVGLVLSVSFNLPVLLTMAEVAIGEVGAVAIGMIILGSMKRARIDLSRLG